uniref:Uncharacterized protein n=1 Tax=Octactis speculum TaxID=3111310 RepID=A0A7S2ATA8_9STRA|mmetsp:Transcript_14721/g.19633  ORF Transcript_14721/g.19633 Transcript_14721/m.19633 type:complete len:257 (+) Transcript_14721:81-851(+)
MRTVGELNSALSIGKTKIEDEGWFRVQNAGQNGKERLEFVGNSKEKTTGPLTSLFSSPLLVAISSLGILLLIFLLVALGLWIHRLVSVERSRRCKSQKDGDDLEDERSPVASCHLLDMHTRHAVVRGDMAALVSAIKSDNMAIFLRDQTERTALHLAAKAGQVGSIRLLCNSGADPSAMDKRRMTPLHLAALEGKAACVKVLLEFSANPLTEDMNGMTAYQLAQAARNDDCASLLQLASITAEKEKKKFFTKGSFP